MLPSTLAELIPVLAAALGAGAVLVVYLARVGRQADPPIRQQVSQEAPPEQGQLVDQLEELTASCRRLTTTLEPDVVYDVILRQFAGLSTDGLSAPRASLWLYDPIYYGFVLAAAHPQATEWLTAERLPLKAPLATVASEHKPMMLAQLPESLLGLIRSSSPTSDGAILIPLVFEGRLLALVLMVCSTAHREAFQRNILATNLFTVQAALAVGAILQREFAMVDPLTRVYNYTYFKERFMQELQRCHRFSLPLSLLLIDIDGFKAINDTYGHQVGDRLLTTTAQMVQQSIRTTDLLARYGGDEFLVMVPELGEGDQQGTCEALPLAERIRQAVAASPIQLGELSLSVTVSIGIGIRDPHAPASFDGVELFRRADEQLYRAKRSGKNRCAFPNGPAA